LISIDEEADEMDFKVIDLGSSFPLARTSQNIEVTTPEYLPPDILDYIDNKQSFFGLGGVTSASGMNSTTAGFGSDLSVRHNPWSIDVWSFGAILLEMVIGFPLWLSYKGRILKDGMSSVCMLGLFGVQGRVNKKISEKQKDIIKRLKLVLSKQFSPELSLGPGLNHDSEFLDLLDRMLDINPKNRISPKEIIDHPFINGGSNQTD
jgi:serine/threonine protein kinase